jgi:hypothetical protein
MEAQHLDDGTIAVAGTARKETFLKMWAGIGWPDQEPGYLCVLGERPDGRYHALWEKTGGLWELGEAAVQVKDRLLIECFWVDARDSVAASYLRTVDGLCFYEPPTPTAFPAGPSAPCSSVGVVTAAVMPVPEKMINNFRSALEKTRGVIMKGRLLIHEGNCPKLVYTLRQPLDDLLTSPVMKALVWVVTALEQSRGGYGLDAPVTESWYRNLPRAGL